MNLNGFAFITYGRLAKFAVALILLSGFFFQMQAQDNASIHSLTKADELRIKAVIRQHILENPEIIAEALQALQEKQQSEQLSANKDALYNSKGDIVLGNPEGDVTLIEFFDYNCPFCRRGLEDKKRLLEEDKNLRIILKEFPILGEDSVDAALISLAVYRHAPEKYLDFHAELLGGQGRATKSKALFVVDSLGLPRDEIMALSSQGEWREALQGIFNLAQDMGITGTPTYILGDEVIPGVAGYNYLAHKVSELRSANN